MSGNKDGNSVQPTRLRRIGGSLIELESQKAHREKQNKILDEDDKDLDSAREEGRVVKKLAEKFGGGLEAERKAREKVDRESRENALKAEFEKLKKEADQSGNTKENIEYHKNAIKAAAPNEPFIQREAVGGKTVILLSDPSLQTEPSLEQEYKAEDIGFSSPLLTSARRVTIKSPDQPKTVVSVAPDLNPEAVTPAPEAPPPRVPVDPSLTFVPGQGANSVIGEEDALTKLLKHIREHPEAQNHKSIQDFPNKDLPLGTSKMVAETAEKIPLRDLGFTKMQEENGQIVYDVELPNAQYTGPIFMPRLDENGLQAKMDDGKPAYDILYYKNGNLDPGQSFVAPEGTPPKGAKSTIKSADRQTILEASKAREIQNQAVRMTQLLADGPGGNPNSNTTPRVSSTKFYPPGRQI